MTCYNLIDSICTVICVSNYDLCGDGTGREFRRVPETDMREWLSAF